MAGRWKIAFFLVLPLLFFSASFSLGSQTFEEKFQIARPQTHYLVLPGTSGSMKVYFRQVLDKVRIFP